MRASISAAWASSSSVRVVAGRGRTGAGESAADGRPDGLFVGGRWPGRVLPRWRFAMLRLASWILPATRGRACSDGDAHASTDAEG